MDLGEAPGIDCFPLFGLWFFWGGVIVFTLVLHRLTKIGLFFAILRSQLLVDLEV